MASLEELEKRLYREKETFSERLAPPELVRQKRSKSVFWKDTPKDKNKKDGRWFFWVLVAAGVLTLAGLLFLIFGGSAIFKKQDIKIEISGAGEIKSGDRISWQVKITNNSKGDIEDSVLVFNFPEDSTPVTGPKPEGVFRERRTLNKIRSGESVLENFDAYVFGGKGAQKQAAAVLEYRPSGGNAVFATDTAFKFTIARSPVSVSFKMPQELRIGQNMEFEVDYSSQADQTIKNLSLKISPPDGFEYISSDPSPIDQNKSIWLVGDLKPSASGSIKIRGILRGANLESKIFTASLGIYDQDKKSFLAYDASSQAAVLRSPFLSVDILASGAADYAASPGETINVELKLRNNLSQEIKNASLEVNIGGNSDPVDLGSLQVESGSYSESSKSIIWNASSHSPFKVMAAGADDKVEFTFKIKNNLALSGNSPRPTVKISANFKPGDAVAGLEGTDVSGSSVYEMKISSKLQIVARGYYSNSVIANSGPLPPKVGNNTTYTIVWSLANMANDLDNVTVKSSLPPYINFKNVISPADANISFDKNSGEITWHAGRVFAGTGFLSPAMQAAFQINLTPSVNQIDTSPVLINQTQVTGHDTFTDKILTSQDSQITTDLPDDPSIGFNQKKVVP